MLIATVGLAIWLTHIYNKYWEAKKCIDKLTTQQQSEREVRRIREQEKYVRLDRKYRRHNLVKIVLRFMQAYENINHTNNINNYIEAVDYLKRCFGEIRKEKPQQEIFVLAIRFCRMEAYYSLCHHSITPSEVETLLNWTQISINHGENIAKVMERYQQYWDSVIEGYIRDDAKKSRIRSIIDDLEKQKHTKISEDLPHVLNMINSVQEHYKNML